MLLFISHKSDDGDALEPFTCFSSDEDDNDFDSQDDADLSDEESDEESDTLESSQDEFSGDELPDLDLTSNNESDAAANSKVSDRIELVLLEKLSKIYIKT